MITHFFTFHKVCEEVVRDYIESKLAKEAQKGQLSHLNKILAKEFKIFLRIRGFPEVILRHRSFSIIDKMVNQGTSTLIHLQNVTILELSKAINFKRRIEFRKECPCSGTTPHKKVKYYQLRDFLKVNCDLNQKRNPAQVPECKQCNSPLLEDLSETVFSTYRVLRVLMEESFQPEIDLYIEEEVLERLIHPTTGLELKEGDHICGLFCLEGVVKFSKVGGRQIGQQTLLLLAVNPKVSTEAQKSQKLALKFRKVSDPLKKVSKSVVYQFPRDINDPNFDYSSPEMTEQACFNLSKILSFVNKDTWTRQPLLSLTGYLCLYMHMINQGQINLKGGPQPKLKKQKTHGLLLQNLSVMVMTQDTQQTSILLKSILGRYLMLHESPFFKNEESLKIWLISHKEGVLLIKYFASYKKQLQNIIISAVEKRTVIYKGSDIQINPTFIILLDPSSLKASKVKNVRVSSALEAEENNSAGSTILPLASHYPPSYLDSIDLCIDCRLVSTFTRENSEMNDVFSANLLTSFYENRFFEEEEERLKHTKQEGLHEKCQSGSKEGDARNKREDEGFQSPQMNLSQNTRISYLCKQIADQITNDPKKAQDSSDIASSGPNSFLVEQAFMKNFKDTQYPKALELLEKYVEQAKQVKRLGERQISALKKLVISLRSFRLTAMGFHSELENMLTNYNQNIIQVEIFDSLMAISLIEHSSILLFGKHTGIFNNSISRFLTALDHSIISDSEFENISKFYLKKDREDLKEAVSHLQEEITVFSTSN